MCIQFSEVNVSLVLVEEFSSSNLSLVCDCRQYGEIGRG